MGREIDKIQYGGFIKDIAQDDRHIRFDIAVQTVYSAQQQYISDIVPPAYQS